MADDIDRSADDEDDVEGHVTVWDVDRLMALPPSGVPEQPPRPAAARTEQPPAAAAPHRRRRFGRIAPSPSTG